jgi:hypothetical protein
MEPNGGEEKEIYPLGHRPAHCVCRDGVEDPSRLCRVHAQSRHKCGLPQCISREAPLGPPGEGLPAVDCMFCAQLPAGQAHKVAFSGYESDWLRAETGIPQGCPLSPSLFLLFISELLEGFQRPENGTLAFGFIDDTNLVAWGDSAHDNCQRLQAAHDRCIAWAKRYGAKFAPEKYQLIHFTRRRRGPK